MLSGFGLIFPPISLHPGLLLIRSCLATNTIGCMAYQGMFCGRRYHREVAAFVFVFEDANRIVVETPEYGHATYIFEMEAPMPAALQVPHI